MTLPLSLYAKTVNLSFLYKSTRTTQGGGGFVLSLGKYPKTHLHKRFSTTTLKRMSSKKNFSSATLKR